MTFFRPILVLFLLLLWGSFAKAETLLDRYNLEDQPETLLLFPKSFKDMSGLALSPDGRLFGHAEKRAIIYLINWREKAVMKTFYFGRPPEKGDFEGMAIAGSRFFLITEKGLLLEGREGGEGEAKLFREHDTELSKTCEIEGLATSSDGEKLLILCRKAKKKALKDKLTIFSWDIAAKKRDEAPFLQIDLLAEGIPEDLRKGEPSGLDILPDGSGLMVLTTDKRFLIELGFDGEIRMVRALHEKRHKNPEGIAITPEGDLIIVDEVGTLRLTVYPPLSLENKPD